MPEKTLTRLALPLVFSFTFRFLFTLVDLVYAAEIKDEVPFGVAAIGLFIPIQTLFIAIWVGVSAGFTATISQAFGKRDQARVASLKAAMIKINIGLVPLLLGLGALIYLTTPYRDLDPALQRDFLTYSLILVFSMPFSGFLSIYPDSIVKAHHDTMSTMRAGIYSTLTNVALNTLFVFVFHWGIAGIAVATVISRYAGLAYAASRVRTLERARLSGDWDGGGAWDRGAASWNRQPLGDILVLAIPGSLAFLLLFCEELILTSLLTALPDSEVYLAAYAVFSRLVSLAIMPVVATAVAILPFVARHAMAGQHQRVRSELRRSLFHTAVLVCIIAIPLGWIFARPLATFLVPGASEEAGESVVLYLALVPFAALAAQPFHQLRPVFEALRKPALGVRVAVFKSLVFGIPLALTGYFVGPMLGVDPLMGILVGGTLGQILASAVTVIATRKLLLEAVGNPEPGA